MRQRHSVGGAVGAAGAALAVLLASACGSAATSATGPTTTIARPGRLALASPATTSNVPAAGAADHLAPWRPTTYTLAPGLPDLGHSATVWRVKPHAVSETDVERFAATLDLTAKPVRTSDGWQVAGADATLRIFTGNGTTQVSYSFGAPGVVGGSSGSTGSGGASTGTAIPPAVAVAVQPGVIIEPGSPIASTGPTAAPTAPPTIPAPVAVPSDAGARASARSLLERLGVLSGGDWSVSAFDSGGVMFACPATAPCPPPAPAVVSARTVVFSLRIEGSVVDAFNWSVTLGSHSRVESLSGTWATATPAGSYPLATTAAAFAELQHGTAHLPGPQPMIANGTVDANSGPTASPSSGPAAGSGSGSGSPAPTVIGTPVTTGMSPTVVRIVGVALGVAEWNAYDNGTLVADLIPTYRFRAQRDGGTPYDIEVLALAPDAITFTNPDRTPKPLPGEPVPQPATNGATAVNP